MLRDERGDYLGDLLLLATRQTGNRFEGLAHLAGRSAAADFGRGFAQELIDGNLERIGERGQLIGAESGGAAFPISDHLLVDSESLGELLLGKTGLLAQGGDAFAERRTFAFRRTACLHGGIIRAVRESY